MAVIADDFFQHFDDFFNYRRDIYEISPQTVKSNRVDLGLFKNIICSQNLKIIDGPAVINFQYYLKKQRQNCGASINRKIFTLRSYGNFLKLYDVSCADALPFYDVLKIRQGYRKRPNGLTPQQISLLFKDINTDTILGIRDYAIYSLMYQLGLRVGEVHAINLANLDFENREEPGVFILHSLLISVKNEDMIPPYFFDPTSRTKSLKVDVPTQTITPVLKIGQFLLSIA